MKEATLISLDVTDKIKIVMRYPTLKDMVDMDGMQDIDGILSDDKKMCS